MRRVKVEQLPYSLFGNDKDCEEYNKKIKLFADSVIDEACLTITPIIFDYINYIKTFQLEEIRKIEEYITELLSFGILWRVYSRRALAVKFAPFITMAKMAEWRKKHQKIKPSIDFIREILLRLFLFRRMKGKENSNIPSLSQIDHVCKWMEATGEFREQAIRFKRLHGFWATKSSQELFKIFVMIDEFTKWFEKVSLKEIGEYTANVDSFVAESAKKYRWRKSRIFCAKIPIGIPFEYG